MYLKIIKRDLKRKKAMNAILLIFITLASMFIASGVQNITAINGAVDDFFEKSGMPDLLVNTIGYGTEDPLSDVLEEMNAVNEFQMQQFLTITTENLKINGQEPPDQSYTTGLSSFEDTPLTVFDKNNQPIETVKPGTVLLTPALMNGLGIKIGDQLTLQLGDQIKSFAVAGIFKHAAVGYIMAAKDDADTFFQIEASFPSQYLYYVNTDDITSVKATLNNNANVISVMEQDYLKNNYILDMVLAGIILVISICLILVAFVMLRFTIGFTLSEEYQQIGVMKAIGIPNLSIRGLYLSKYALLSCLGCVIGFIGSIPFGNLLLESVSESIVMESSGGLMINALCSASVVAVTLLFCFSCTRKIRRFTPMDAIRSGTTGERFKKKGILNLSKSPARPAVFMAINDILGSPKRFGIVTLIFTLCLSLVLMLVNTVNTLRSDNLISAFGLTKTDLYMVRNTDELLDFFHEDGRQRATDYLEDLEQTLAQHDLPAECSLEIMISALLTHEGTEHKTNVMQGIRNHADQYDYYEGTAPQYPDEIAITAITAEALGVQIGDTITMKLKEGDRQFIITALYQSMLYMGEGVRLHQDADISFQNLAGMFSTQIDFSDNPEPIQLEARVEQIASLLDTDEVYTAGEYVDKLAQTADTLQNIQVLTLTVTIIIIALVTVLMEKSFIIKERGEIAVMKAIGFSNGTILAWHTLRFGLVALVSAGLSMALTAPLTKLCIDPVFNIMGADFGVAYEINSLQVYAIYPAIILLITTVFAAITALSTRKIQPRDCTGND